MTLAKAFVTYLQTLGYGTYGTNLFIGGVPQNAPDICMWVLIGGGRSLQTNQTGEKLKQFVFSIYYRHTKAQIVDETLSALEVDLNTSDCTQLNGYDTMNIEAVTFPADQDIDSERRSVGLLQANVDIYQ